MKKIFLALLLMPCLVFANDNADDEEIQDFNSVRKLSNPDKTASFEATITKYDGKKVSFIRKGQKSATTVEVNKFSDEDKEWLDENKEEINAQKQDNSSAPAAKKGEPNKLGQELEGKTVILGKDGFIPHDKQVVDAEYYLIVYSASWCPPCREEMPAVVKFGKLALKDPKVEVVLASADKSESDALSWAKDERMPFPIIKQGDRNKVPTVSALSPGGIPHAILIKGKTNEIVTRGRPTEVIKAYKKLPK